MRDTHNRLRKVLHKAAIPLCVLGLVLGASGLRAAPGDQLGKVNFPTTCSDDVQPMLDKGLALLHSFQYKESEETFTEAATRAPKCAMTHWGKAMALYHQLWDFPQENTLKEGRKYIEQAQKVRSGDPRDKSFIAAAAAFFQKSKMSHADRVKAYSSSLASFYLVNPEDSEIGSLYALSLIALAEEDVDSIGNRERAIAILKPLLEKYPDHPGIAHYLIHAADRPELASQGLEAARRYAAIAPDSSHALHMPSHIFVRLGLWQDSINSNVAASASAAHAAEMHMAEAHYQTHAMDFLSYSYLQSGQEAKAREVIEHMDHIVGASEEVKAEHRAYLAARTALELHRWKEAAELPVQGIPSNSQDTTYWAQAIGAARSGDVRASANAAVSQLALQASYSNPMIDLGKGAASAVKKLAQVVGMREQRARKEGYGVSTEKATDLSEATAWMMFALGEPEKALGEIRAAADREDKNGGESVGIPAREMLADMLLELKRPVDALTEYKASLKLYPNRFDSLLGAARAAQASGNATAAQTYYAQLTSVCAPAADRPELAEAKTYRARK